jgi:hypothetical protein
MAVFKPFDDRTETLPYFPDTERGVEFLNTFIKDTFAPSSTVAGYRPFIPVAPSDIDPGGSEPGAEAAMAEYIRGRRDQGDFQRARERLMQRGFPLGGV